MALQSSAKAIIPKVSYLSSRVIMILGCNPGVMTLQGTNTYLVGTGKRRILLDTGDADVPQYTEQLHKVLTKESCDIEQIVISHWHHDHIGGVPDVLKLTKPDCKVWKFQQADDKGNVVESKIPFECLTDGQILSTEGASLRVIHTPGHTTDHAVFTLEEEDVLFSADTILGEGTAVFEDLLDYMKSLRKIQKINPKVIYPGHGPVIKDPQKVISYYLSHRESREEEILNVLMSNNGPICAANIVKVIYPDLDIKLLLAAENNVKKHLIKLMKEGKVVKDNEMWKVICSSS
ncbi:endoribonuclease LACTB2 [Homalodisca vitripennis]|uniref:endoribonuclease LACTB2 n=1 Tax=Homalodisca vitripennis TaxID=197043 RepID=UPI001EEB8DB1|nr:endoribonuclease LACTB2 [Homalodisca vitripennis]